MIRVYYWLPAPPTEEDRRMLASRDHEDCVVEVLDNGALGCALHSSAAPGFFYAPGEWHSAVDVSEDHNHDE